MDGNPFKGQVAVSEGVRWLPDWVTIDRRDQVNIPVLTDIDRLGWKPS
jgi:hypothetical protein